MTPCRIVSAFSMSALGGRSTRKTALLINPPVYDTQYWAEWSQPYGLLRIAALLEKDNYKKLWLYDFMEAGEDRKVRNHRINPHETRPIAGTAERAQIQSARAAERAS